jgi:hypothetical protein
VAVAIAVIIILLVIGGLVAVSRIRRGYAVQPGPGQPGLISPPAPAVPPGEPGFFIHQPPDPGFKIEHLSAGRATPSRGPANHTVPNNAGGKGFSPGESRTNLTAFCKLTGKTAAECTCERHKGLQPKGTG